MMGKKTNLLLLSLCAIGMTVIAVIGGTSVSFVFPLGVVITTGLTIAYVIGHDSGCKEGANKIRQGSTTGYKTLEQQIQELWASKGLEVTGETFEAIDEGTFKWTITARRVEVKEKEDKLRGG